jgi:hypothetical protein
MTHYAGQLTCLLLVSTCSVSEGSGGWSDYAKQVNMERLDTDRAAALQLGGSCTDHLKDEDETDVDCGGLCDRCPAGKKCHSHSDCTSGYCDPADLRCIEEKSVDKCTVGEWTRWTKCSRACGTGEKKRMRKIQGPSQVCPHDAEIVLCNQDPCKGNSGETSQKAAQDQGAINDLDQEFSKSKQELSTEMAQMRKDLLDSNEDPQSLEKAGALNAKEQQTMNTMLQASNAVNALKFDEEEVNIVQQPHELGQHGYLNGKFSGASLRAGNGEQYCPGPVIEACKSLAMGGPTCIKCMRELSSHCMQAQANTLCYASGSGDSDYQVTPEQAFDAAVATGKPEPVTPNSQHKQKSTLSKTCWAVATNTCKYDPDGPDGDDDENRVRLGGDACERCVLTKLPNKCARFVRSRPKFSKQFCGSLFDPMDRPEKNTPERPQYLRGAIPIRRHRGQSTDDDVL